MKRAVKKRSARFRKRAKAASTARAIKARQAVTKHYRAERIRLNSGGYDSRGRYFGTGQKLYQVTSTKDGTNHLLRAPSAAKAKIDTYNLKPWQKSRDW